MDTAAFSNMSSLYRYGKLGCMKIRAKQLIIGFRDAGRFFNSYKILDNSLLVDKTKLTIVDFYGVKPILMNPILSLILLPFLLLFWWGGI